MKYIILANSNDKKFDIPRQLVEINGEPLVKRTIRLLKENGVKDIIITAKDKRFDNLGVKKYEPVNSDYNYTNGKGYWLNAFPFELMNEPICFIWGDVYFSEEAIKTIVETKTDSTLFFCTYNNKSQLYIKEHDEPLAYKVVDIDLFKEHITKVKKMKDDGLCCREPIVWELYRSIHNQDINTHKMTTDYVAINDISCDIDSQTDLDKIKMKIGGEKLKLSVIIPYYKTYELTCNLLDVLVPQLNNDVEVYLIDDGCNEKRLDKYKDKINIIHLEENAGATIAMNTGIKKSAGKYIAIIDSDDMIDIDYIGTLLETIKNRTEDVIFFDWQDMGNGRIVRRPSNYAPWKAIYKRSIMPLFREGWRFSYDVPFQEDLDKRYYTKYYIDKVLYYYNSEREDNLTHIKEKIIKEERKNKMVKAEAIKEFTLSRFDELKNIKRKNEKNNEKGKLYIGDTFECQQDLAEYLNGKNDKNQVVIKILEVIPEKVEEVKEEIKEEPPKEIGKPRKNKRKR